MKLIKCFYGGSTSNPILMNPQPSSVYIVGPNDAQRKKGIEFEHIFTTDASKIVDSVWVKDLRFVPGAVRNNSQPAGKKPTGKWDRGHLVAKEFGGGMETINLLWMPAPANRNRYAESALDAGFPNLAAQNKRFIGPKNPTGDEVRNPFRGTLNPNRGDWDLPNYRQFEEEARDWIAKGFKVGVHIRPDTFESKEGYMVVGRIDADLYIGDMTNPMFRFRIEINIG